MVERDLRKLSPEIQDEIQKIADRLSGGREAALFPAIEGFSLNGKEYKAYFVPEAGPDGRMELVFRCLFY